MSDATVQASDRITIRTEWCKSCGICVAVCPKEGLEMIEGLPELMRPEVCTGCGICEQHCPDFAIEVKARRRKSEATDG